MLVSDFDFELPDELIAQEPPLARGESRLLVLPRGNGGVGHSSIAALPTLLRAGDVLVLNNTRVFPARLLGHRLPSGGAVECLLVRRVDTAAVDAPEQQWEASMHPGQKLKPGAEVVFEGATPLLGQVIERRFFGRRLVVLRTTDGTPVQEAVERIGHMPLPPYIRRGDGDADRDRYQTVYAQTRGSIAAPTAGLHFTHALFHALERAGVLRAEVTLHVGYGTFQPVRVDNVEDHRLEAEHYQVSPDAAAVVNAALDEGRRIVAVGTTTTRTLEAVGRANGGRMVASHGAADLFIYPGVDFKIVSGLLTNFHLPQSSLLMLVSAFAGRERVLDAYRQAVQARYRFYSYGDAMLML